MTRASQSPPHVTPAIVLGTANRHKAAELIDLLLPLGLRFETLADVPIPIEFAGMFAAIPEEEFRADVSSTKVRPAAEDVD